MSKGLLQFVRTEIEAMLPCEGTQYTWIVLLRRKTRADHPVLAGGSEEQQGVLHGHR